jgi:hypothetical protein
MVTRIADQEIMTLEKSDLRKRLKAQSANRDFLYANYHVLLNRYRNHWIVISGGKLLRTEKKADALFDSLDQLKIEDSLVFYLSDPEESMIL